MCLKFTLGFEIYHPLYVQLSHKTLESCCFLVVHRNGSPINRDSQSLPISPRQILTPVHRYLSPPTLRSCGNSGRRDFVHQKTSAVCIQKCPAVSIYWAGCSCSYLFIYLVCHQKVYITDLRKHFISIVFFFQKLYYFFKLAIFSFFLLFLPRFSFYLKYCCFDVVYIFEV